MVSAGADSSGCDTPELQPQIAPTGSGEYGQLADTVGRPVKSGRDEEFTAYITARLAWLGRVAYLLCHDASHAEDLVQTAITRLYVHWRRAAAADNIDGPGRRSTAATILRGPPPRSTELSRLSAPACSWNAGGGVELRRTLPAGFAEKR
jgi:hypothetical protein